VRGPSHETSPAQSLELTSTIEGSETAHFKGARLRRPNESTRRENDPKARHTARYGHAAPLLLPPNLHVPGELAFSLEDFRALDKWLAEPGWPDNTPTPLQGRGTPLYSGRYFAGAAWATGFMTALHENSSGLGSRSSAVRSAVEDIARYASLRSLEPSALPAAATAISVAVMIIMSERPPRGSVAAAPKIKVRANTMRALKPSTEAENVTEMRLVAESTHRLIPAW